MSDQVLTILRAADFAARRHKTQRRKGIGREPYINHPLEVALLVATLGGISDPEVLAAAILHDTIEDTDTLPDEIKAEFGVRTSSIVEELTDDKTTTKAERKLKQIEHAPHLSPEAKVIKLADKISNIEGIITSPPDGWSNERRREYVAWGVSVVAGLKGVNAELESAFERLVDKAREELDSQP